jgi:assimilatory nitrate reductase catalytic subunit
MTPSGVATHCPYCALQCGMTVRPTPGGLLPVEINGRDGGTVNRGALCGKGSAAAEPLAVGARLAGPLVRDGDGLRAATWDEALDRAAAGLAAVRRSRGPDAVGVFGSGALTNEKAYLLGKFARVALGTANIDYNGRFCMAAAAAASRRAFGLDRGLPFPVSDIARTDAVLLVGSNIAETMPPLLPYFRELRERGGLLITVDPRRTRTADAGDLHLRTLPGTDLALALGMLHLICAEKLVDEDFVAARTSGFDEVAAIAAEYDPDRVERLTGVPQDALREAVLAFAAAPTGMILTARGSEQHHDGADTVSAWINLALALGKAGRPLCGYGPITGQGNGQGGREHGQKADQLPGYRSIADPAARAHVAKVWNVDPDSLPGAGMPAAELLATAGTADGVSALFVMASNPVVSAPHAGRAEERLGSLDFLVVADVVLSETAALADVVLPGAQWAEESGTTTNLEGRVLLRRRVLDRPDSVRTDLEILAELARRLGAGTGFDTDAETVFAELARASAGGAADYSGIDYALLASGRPIHWPCADGVGTPRVLLDRFATPDGRARFHPVRFHGVAEAPDRRFPYRLTTGRVALHYQSGAQTRRSPSLNAAEPEAFAEIHPRLAAREGISDGAMIRLSSERGSITVRARVTDTIRPDTVFVPFHWPGEGRANTLTGGQCDPVSGMPEFKVAAVRVEGIDR